MNDAAIPPSAPRPGSDAGVSPAGTGRRSRGLDHIERRRSSTPPARADGSRSRRAALGALGWRVADAYLLLIAMGVLELLTVAVLRWSELTAAFELAIGLIAVLPWLCLVAAPCALVGGFVAELVSREGEHARPAKIGLMVLGALAGASVGFGVTTGRRFLDDGVGLRVVVVAATALVAVAATVVVAARWTHTIRKLPKWSAAGAVLALAASVEIANQIILPRLYPAFHAGLLGLAAVTVALVTTWSSYGNDGAHRSRRFVRVAVALVLFACGAAAAIPASAQLARLDNLRFILHQRSPALAPVLELAALVGPEDADSGFEGPGSMKSVNALHWGGRDIVLITVDALRADHVGAYGYERPVTPHLDALAEGGVVFEAAYTATPHTSYAMTSLLTGKYMRPLLRQGLGAGSPTLATYLRKYGYQTAGFYPPAVFFIDTERFDSFRDNKLDFEYAKVQFATAQQRVEEVTSYFDSTADERPQLLWVHLFEPHEPYERHAEHAFGDRDIDRYDGEIAAADAGIGKIVDEVRRARPNAIVIVTADHGEEFGEHGGRYHGTTVYEEQVRVPLVVHAPGLLEPRRVEAPVQLIDVVPTLLSSLDIPRPARVRGSDLSPLLLGKEPVTPPRAFAETDEHTLLAKDHFRLVCARRIGACALYDVRRDPRQTQDLASARADQTREMRQELQKLEASHGRFEQAGLRAEGKGWPEPLRRGLAGDGDAAREVAALLDDADVEIRRKAAEVLFDLRRREVTSALRLALQRDEDRGVRVYSALALTRLGEGAPLTRELLERGSQDEQRLAALALAEAGDDRGERILLRWWLNAFPSKDDEQPEALSFERARDIARALANIRSEVAVGPLLRGLEDVRLRPVVADALASIGSDAARPALAERLLHERHESARRALVDALVRLGAGPELRAPLVRWLGTPDPLAGGVKVAVDTDLINHVGGPRERDLKRLRKLATSGVAIDLLIPKPVADSEPLGSVRVLCRVRSKDGRRGEIRVGRRKHRPPQSDQKSLIPAEAPELDPQRSMRLVVDGRPGDQEIFGTAPKGLGLEAGEPATLVFYATQNVEVDACVAVPEVREMPPPPPEPWSPDDPAP